MKIRTKYILVHFLIVAGFLVSMAFIVERFFHSYRLKELEYNAYGTLTGLQDFRKKTEYFTLRYENLGDLFEDWNTSYQEFSESYSALEENSSRFRYHARLRNRLRYERWDDIRRQEIEPLIVQVRSLTSQTDADGELLLIAAGPDDAMYSELVTLRIRFSLLAESLVSSLQIPMERFLSSLHQEIDSFSASIYFVVFAIAVVMHSIGIAAGIWTSRSFIRHFVHLERMLSDVADGNFDISLNISTGDEIEDIARRFQLLTQNLWARLDTMKDMMRTIGGGTGEGVDLDMLQESMLSMAVDSTTADAGVLMDVDEGMLGLSKIQGFCPPPLRLPPMVSIKQEYITEWFKKHRIASGEGVLGRMMQNGEPLFVRNNHKSQLLSDNADPETAVFISSAILIPLNVSGAVWGILGLVRTREGEYFSDLDYTYMLAFSEFLALTVDNIRKYLALVESRQTSRDIEVAADIQRALLPEKIPQMDSVEAGAFNYAARGVSGDYYDVFSLGNGKTAFVICDVAGKGVPASLLMIMIRTVIRSVCSAEKSADATLTELNRAITGRLQADHFATFSLVIFDSVHHTISYSNGAHHPLYILRNDSGRYRKFDTEGLPLGIDPEASFGHKRIRVRAGDCLILFTDGLSEARSSAGIEMGTNRLLRFIAKNADSPPAELVEAVKKYIDDFSAGVSQHDDQTFLAIKITDRPADPV